MIYLNYLKNGLLKNKLRSYDEKVSEEFKANLIKLIDDEKRANIKMSRMKKEMEKQ